MGDGHQIERCGGLPSSVNERAVRRHQRHTQDGQVRSSSGPSIPPTPPPRIKRALAAEIAALS